MNLEGGVGSIRNFVNDSSEVMVQWLGRDENKCVAVSDLEGLLISNFMSDMEGSYKDPVRATSPLTARIVPKGVLRLVWGSHWVWQAEASYKGGR